MAWPENNEPRKVRPPIEPMDKPGKGGGCLIFVLAVIAAELLFGGIIVRWIGG